MELIKISSTKLKIMLSAEDMKSLDFDPVDREDISCRAGFRSILREARDRCGFDAVGDRVFVQYYPEKHGGCEMFVTKLEDRGGNHNRQMYKSYVAGKKAARFSEEGYILYEYSDIHGLISTCGRLFRAGYDGSCSAYKCEKDSKYYILLNSPVLFAGEDGGTEISGKYRYFLSEHGRLLCENAVALFGKLD